MNESRSFDGPTRALARLAARWPGLAYPLAARLGALRNRITRRWPTRDEVSALFPNADATRTAAAIGALNERNRVLVHCIARRGLDPIRHLVHFNDPPPPCILAAFHVGAIHALGPALERLNAPVLAFRQRRLFTPRPPLEIVETEGDEQQRAAAFHRAIVTLRGGGYVLIAIDAASDAATDTHCLGRTLRLAPGAFALARLTGAPIVPIVGRWSGAGVRVLTGDPVDSADAAAAWVARYLLESPSQITIGFMRHLI